jgi:hypothetical protein
MLEVAAHEMGHYYIGLVHYNGYGLMGNCGIMNSFEREQLGWKNIQNITSDQFNLTIPSLVNDGSAFKIVRQDTAFYVEGRYADNLYQTQWSNKYGLKSPGSGVLVLRVPPSRTNYDVLFANNILWYGGRPLYSTDYFNPGYNEILSYYGHPSTFVFNDKNFGIRFANGSNGKINANIYINTSILTAQPSKPYNLRITNTTGWVQLAWNANAESDITGYNVYRKINSSGFELIGSTSSSQTSYYDCEIRIGGDQVVATYKVTAVDNTSQESIYSDPVSAHGRYFPTKKNPLLSLDTTIIRTGLSTFPNPFNPSTEIRFSIERDAKTRVSVSDMLGREVTVLYDDYLAAFTEQRVVFDGKALPSGIYFVRLAYGSNYKVSKVLLMK